MWETLYISPTQIVKRHIIQLPTFTTHIRLYAYGCYTVHYIIFQFLENYFYWIFIFIWFFCIIMFWIYRFLGIFWFLFFTTSLIFFKYTFLFVFLKIFLSIKEHFRNFVSITKILQKCCIIDFIKLIISLNIFNIFRVNLNSLKKVIQKVNKPLRKPHPIQTFTSFVQKITKKIIENKKIQKKIRHIFLLSLPCPKGAAL